jgi:hypothetical protein
VLREFPTADDICPARMLRSLLDPLIQLRPAGRPFSDSPRAFPAPFIRLLASQWLPKILTLAPTTPFGWIGGWRLGIGIGLTIAREVIRLSQRRGYDSIALESYPWGCDHGHP